MGPLIKAGILILCLAGFYCSRSASAASALPDPAAARLLVVERQAKASQESALAHLFKREPEAALREFRDAWRPFQDPALPLSREELRREMMTAPDRNGKTELPPRTLFDLIWLRWEITRGMARAHAEQGEFNEAQRWLTAADNEIPDFCGAAAVCRASCNETIRRVWDAAGRNRVQVRATLQRFMNQEILVRPDAPNWDQSTRKLAAREAALLLGEQYLREGRLSQAIPVLRTLAGTKESDIHHESILAEAHLKWIANQQREVRIWHSDLLGTAVRIPENRHVNPGRFKNDRAVLAMICPGLRYRGSSGLFTPARFSRSSGQYSLKETAVRRERLRHANRRAGSGRPDQLALSGGGMPCGRIGGMVLHVLPGAPNQNSRISARLHTRRAHAPLHGPAAGAATLHHS